MINRRIIVAMNEPRELLPEELGRRAVAAGSMDALKASGAFDELAQIDSGSWNSMAETASSSS